MTERQPGIKRAPSMRDVAEAANVSVQTVSRVLNDKDNVSEATRDRVNAAIDELNYHRNIAALSLVTSHSRVLGIIDFSQAHTGSRDTIRAIQSTAYANDYFVSIAHVENMSASSVRAVIGSMLQQSVAGILFVAPHHEALSTISELKLSTPFVVVAPRTKFNFVSVSVDHKNAAQVAIDHLTSLGHRRLVHLCGPLDWVDSSAKMESWYAGVKNRALPLFPTYVGDWTAKSGYEITKQIIDETNPSAIFAANDQMALGVMCALQEMGYRIPQDISVVGFGNMDDSEFYFPRLTTIQEGNAEAGGTSVNLLLSIIAGDDAESVNLAPQLLVRSSTGPARESA